MTGNEVSKESANAIRAAAERAQAIGADGAAAAREMAWGLVPALPATLLSELVDILWAPPKTHGG